MHKTVLTKSKNDDNPTKRPFVCVGICVPTDHINVPEPFCRSLCSLLHVGASSSFPFFVFFFFWLVVENFGVL